MKTQEQLVSTLERIYIGNRTTNTTNQVMPMNETNQHYNNRNMQNMTKYSREQLDSDTSDTDYLQTESSEEEGSSYDGDDGSCIIKDKSTDDNPFQKKSLEWSKHDHECQGATNTKKKKTPSNGHVRFSSNLITEIHFCPEINEAEYGLLYYSAHELQKLMDEAARNRNNQLLIHSFESEENDDQDYVGRVFGDCHSDDEEEEYHCGLYDSYFGKDW